MSESKKRLAWRQRGYSDGLAGRRARSLDADYQAGWRSGQVRRARDQAAARGAAMTAAAFSLAIIAVVLVAALVVEVFVFLHTAARPTSSGSSSQSSRSAARPGTPSKP